MSAAATAAGYLYASGRLRGKAQREQEHHDEQPAAQPSRPHHYKTGSTGGETLASRRLSRSGPARAPSIRPPAMADVCCFIWRQL